MHKRLKAAVAPVVVAATIMSWAGFARALDTGSPPRRLDELSEKRPVAASHFPVEGALIAASQAALEQRWIEGVRARQMELFLQAAAAGPSRLAAGRRRGPGRP